MLSLLDHEFINYVVGIFLFAVSFVVRSGDTELFVIHGFHWIRKGLDKQILPTPFIHVLANVCHLAVIVRMCMCMSLPLVCHSR